MRDIITNNLILRRDFTIRYKGRVVQFFGDTSELIGIRDGVELFRDNIADMPLRLLGDIVDLLCEKEGTIIM